MINICSLKDVWQFRLKETFRLLVCSLHHAPCSPPSGNIRYKHNPPSSIAAYNKKSHCRLLFMSDSQAYLAPDILPHIKTPPQKNLLQIASVYFTFPCLLRPSYFSLFQSRDMTRRGGKNSPSNRSKRRPISCSTICPSNGYLDVLWCDTDGWRGSRANIFIKGGGCDLTLLCCDQDSY